MSALPKAIQQQLDQANAMEAQIAAELAPAEPGTPVPSTVTQPPLQLVEPPAAPAPVIPAVPEETWEQRFRIMEGKYKAEVPRLFEQNRELSEQLDRAIKALETATAAPEKPTPESRITDADVEEFGPRLIALIGQIAEDKFTVLSQALVASLDTRFGAVDARVSNTEEQVVKTRSDKFWEQVLKDHPDFDAINDDPRWFAFLDSRVAGTKITRRVAANAAIQEMDAVTLCEQLREFKDSLGISPGGKPTPAVREKTQLNVQVAPSTSRASAPTTPTARIWTGQEYAAALDHRNLRQMTRDEYDALVAEAETALAEGRVKF